MKLTPSIYEAVFEVVFEAGQGSAAGGYAEYSFNSPDLSFNFIFTYGQCPIIHENITTGEKKPAGDHVAPLHFVHKLDKRESIEHLQNEITKKVISLRSLFEPLLLSMEAESTPTPTQNAVFKIPLQLIW